jgi:DNA repair exonuclease SbcCD ATPase subunit
MKRIYLKSMTLTNFKGIRKQEIEFSSYVTSIYGRNATGKTTIFDAFTWVLFGKNSDDRKQFNIKTLDADGQVIPKLPHEVSLTLEVDGEEITLRKSLNEKWQKKRGSSVEEFTGNEEQRFYNEVPLSLKEWNEKIANICDEDTFRTITNPLYFTSLKWDAQRAVLIDMAGDIEDEEILEYYPNFKNLLGQLTGKTIDEYRREIGAKKKIVKNEIEGLPERIDERKRDIPESTNFNLIVARLHHKEQEYAEVQMLLEDKAKAYEKKYAEARQKGEKLNELKIALVHEKNTLTTLAMREKMQRDNRISELKAIMNYATIDIKNRKESLEYKQKEIEECRAEWKSIKKEQLEIDENAFICPTCKRPLDADDVEAKKAELDLNFNLEKAKRIEGNMVKGKRLKAEIEQLQEQINECEERLQQAESELVALVHEKTDTPPVTTNDKIQELEKQIAELEELVYNTPLSHGEENAELTDKRDALKAEVAELNRQLGLKDVYESNLKRIKELEDQLKKQNEELARLEGVEFDIECYQHTRIEMLEQKINKIFSVVNWKLFNEQINGGVQETCQAMVNGVPFADLNNAMKINAGLDIINTISEYTNTSAPIFIDNAEAVNELEETQSQLIRLVVSEDSELKINK